MDFPFPDDIEPVCIEGKPEESYALIAFSLLLPYLEPYLIRTMKVARKQVRDPALREDVDRFNAQEGQHFRQHQRFNQVIRSKGFPRLAELEDELRGDYQRFSEERSLRFNLAYAEGFEALTTASARFAFESKQLSRMHPSVGDLFMWHLIEELEHRTVAFEVYEHVCGGYFYRLLVGLYAQWHMGRWIARVARYMLEADPEAFERYGGRAGRRARGRAQLRRTLRGLLPKVLGTSLPWYTPARIPFTAEMRSIADQYSERAQSTS